MLHVTNGDVAVTRIRQAAIEGQVLPWQDVLHDGPVPSGLDDDALRETRARFIAGEFWADLDTARSELAARDAALAAAKDPVVLWFEHDLYDQLQLLQVLDRLADRAAEGLVVEMVDPPTYLGMLDPDFFRGLFDLRDEVPPEAFQLGRAAWAAFRSPEPTQIEAFLERDTSILPNLDPALRRLLEEFPAVDNGLSRTEGQTLEAVAGGARTVREAYHAAHHAREEAVFLGDAGFVSVLRRLVEAYEPLVVRVDGGSFESVGFDDDRGARRHRDVLDFELELTPAGRLVLDGLADHVALNGVDRWLGGVHLQGREAAWRWDPAAGRIVPS
jgi:hypothetical protein